MKNARSQLRVGDLKNTVGEVKNLEVFFQINKFPEDTISMSDSKDVKLESISNNSHENHVLFEAIFQLTEICVTIFTIKLENHVIKYVIILIVKLENYNER